MHEYRFQATEESVEHLRKLRGEWRSFVQETTAVIVELADDVSVRIQVEAADVEDAFEAFRLEALLESTDGDTSGVATADALDFAAGTNDVVLFTGAAWSDPGAAPTAESLAAGALPAGASMHFSGHPGQLSDTADVVCLTTDAIVIAAPTGAGMLIRTGLKPYSLDVIRDRETIAAFLLERGYRDDTA